MDSNQSPAFGEIKSDRHETRLSFVLSSEMASYYDVNHGNACLPQIEENEFLLEISDEVLESAGCELLSINPDRSALRCEKFSIQTMIQYLAGQVLRIETPRRGLSRR
jgi:hypothetical protein